MQFISSTRMMLVAIALVASIVFGAGRAKADYSRGGAFTTPGYGARAWGMGGAATLTVEDEGAVFWNPAMMGRFQARNLIGASYVNLVAGATAHQSQLAYGRTLEAGTPDEGRRPFARHAVGALYTNVHFGIQGGVDYDEHTFRIAYAYTPDPFISFGIAGDLLISRSDVPDFDALGSSVDFALRAALLEEVSLGFVARNAFSQYRFDYGDQVVREREFVLAVATDALPVVAAEGDIVWARNDVARLALGAETDYLFDRLALRAGFALIRIGESRSVPYAGFGFRAGAVTLNYNANFDKDTAFSDTHRFSMSVSL
jgi:hypothetical protein